MSRKSNEILITTELGKFIRNKRNEKQLKLSDLGKEIKTSEHYILRVEKGLSPLNWEYLNSISNVLNVDVKELALLNLKASSSYKKYEKLIKENN